MILYVSDSRGVGVMRLKCAVILSLTGLHFSKAQQSEIPMAMAMGSSGVDPAMAHRRQQYSIFDRTVYLPTIAAKCPRCAACAGSNSTTMTRTEWATCKANCQVGAG